MQILIEPHLFRDALFGRGNSVGKFDSAQNILSSQRYIHGYLSDRGLDSIRNDLQKLHGCSTAEQVISWIATILDVCQVTSTIMDEALGLELDLDLAIEWACARVYKYDAILTQKFEEFIRAGHMVVSADELLKGDNVHQFFRSANLPLVIGGTLQDLSQLEQVASTLQYLKTLSAPTQLSSWVHRVYDSRWQPVDELLIVRHQTLSFRGESDPLFSNYRGKLLELGVSPEDTLVLMVGVRYVSKKEMDIQVEVCSASDQRLLPSSLELLVLNGDGEIAMGTQPHEDESILLRFSVEPGEKFDVRLTLGNTSITEAFVV